jgi:hypothetical protein
LGIDAVGGAPHCDFAGERIEHEEVLLMPRWVKAKRVTFKYGLGTEFIDVLKTLNKLGLDKTEPVNVKASRSHRGMSWPRAFLIRRSWEMRCTARRAPGCG